MKTAVQLIFNLLIITTISIGLYLTRNWPRETALFPQTIGFPVLALSVVTLVLGLVNARREWASVGRNISSSDRNFVVSTVRIFGWLAGFAVAIWAFGFQFSVPLFVFFYMKLQGKLSWLVCVLFTVSATAFVFIVFDLVFHVSWPEGIVWKVLVFK